MAELIVEDIEWKKGEEGLQKFIIYESDNNTRRNGTGKSYEFKFWSKYTKTLKDNGSLVATDEVNGEYDYIVKAADTDTVGEFLGEIIEDPDGAKLRSNTFNVNVNPSSDL